MKFWTMALSLTVALLVAVNAPAQEGKKHPLRDRFEKMDTNHDGLLTVNEFVAGHPKMGPDKATKFYNEFVAFGGSTTKGDVTGMTFPQFKKAHKAWKESHPKKAT